MPLIVALGFLTALPLPRMGTAGPEQLARSLAWFPVAGALVGGLLVLLDLALGLVLPVGVRAALLLVALLALTRGLHFDGLMDVCDGLFGGFTPERRLAIMRAGGTAFITDVGMTGSFASVIGVKKEQAIERFRTSRSIPYETADGDVRLAAVTIDIDPASGHASAMTRIELAENVEDEAS